MTDPLPHRSFTELPAPTGGIATALRDGRRIRHRRRTAGAGAAALSLALVAGVVVAMSSTGSTATDELVPADVPSAAPTAAPSAPAPKPVTPARPGVAAPPVAASPAAAPSLLSRRPSPSPSHVGVVAGDPGGYRTPDLTRRYRPAPPQTGPPSGRICSGSSEGSTGGVTNGTGYCLTGVVTGTGRGHDLVVEICRDSTGPGRLRFPRELEVDLVVHDLEDRDRAVWQWAAGRTNDLDAHALDLETSACWTWTAGWTDVDRTGKRLEEGRYELQVVGHATEVRSVRAVRVPFTIG